MALSLHSRVLSTVALLVAIGSAAPAQVPVDRLRDVLTGAGPLRDILREDPVTTSIEQATTAAPTLDDFAPARWLPLRDQPQDADGVFHLAPGSYRFEAASYCLHAGTHGPGHGDGYLYAPLEGARSGVIRSILQRSVDRPDIPQQDIQVLLWAILARTPVDQMPRGARIAATALLAPDQVLELGVGRFPAMTPGIWSDSSRSLPPAMARVFQAESRLRQLFAHADTPYVEFERVAVLLGDPQPDEARRDVPRGRWSLHPDGYYIRFFPSGYSRTRIEVHVPAPMTSGGRDAVAEAPAFRFASRADAPGVSQGGSTAGGVAHPGSAATVRVDLSEAVAVPAETGRQRLAMSGREH